MIASLGMYDRAETASANDRFWADIALRLRDSGIPAPAKLNRDTPFWETWTAPDLLFSQTCGRPFRLKLHDTTTLIGTPDYGLADCDPGYYRSVFLVRKHDPRSDLSAFRPARFAYNEELSQSGWSAPQCHVTGLGFRFENLWQSGSHLASAKAVANGRVDIAALDAMTWELIKRYEDFSLDLRVLDKTAQSPGLPYITSKKQDPAPITLAVEQAIAALDLADRRTLRLNGLVQIPAADYLAVPNP